MYTYIMSHRTQITLSDEQYRRLLLESSRTGLGLAELVRRALDRVYAGPSTEETLRWVDDSFGIWADREDDEDGVAYVARLRQGINKRLESLE